METLTQNISKENIINNDVDEGRESQETFFDGNVLESNYSKGAKFNLSIQVQEF